MRRSLRQQVGGGWQGVRALGLCIDEKSQHRWMAGLDGHVCSLCTQLKTLAVPQPVPVPQPQPMAHASDEDGYPKEASKLIATQTQHPRPKKRRRPNAQIIDSDEHSDDCDSHEHSDDCDLLAICMGIGVASALYARFRWKRTSVQPVQNVPVCSALEYACLRWRLFGSFKSFKVQKVSPKDDNASQKFKRRKKKCSIVMHSFCFELNLLILQMFNFPHLSIHEEVSLVLVAS